MRPSDAPPRLRLVVVVALLAVGVLVALVLVLRGGGDQQELRIVRGAPAAGFPLRGSGAGDDATIRSAAEAWVRKARREDEPWVDDSSLEVTALWAGRLSRDTDGVVLVVDGEAAVLERLQGRDDWQIDAAVAGEATDPVLVAGAGAVLVREDTEASFVLADARNGRDPAVGPNDGLWHGGSADLPGGALLLPDGLRSRFTSARSELPSVGVFVPGSVASGAERSPALRELSPRLLRRLAADADELSPRTERSDPARRSAQRLVAAASAAGATDGEHAPPQRPTALPRLDLVTEGIVEPLGPVVVLSVTSSRLGSPSDDRRPALVAAAGGSAVAGRRDAATAIRLGATDVPLRGTDGPAFGAAYVTSEARPDGTTSSAGDPASTADDDAEPRVHGPYLLVAGDEQVAAVEVRAGRRTVSVRVPLGLVRADWLREPGTPAPSPVDVAVLGRSSSGALVVPALPRTGVVAVRVGE